MDADDQEKKTNKAGGEPETTELTIKTTGDDASINPFTNVRIFSRLLSLGSTTGSLMQRGDSILRNAER